MYKRSRVEFTTQTEIDISFAIQENIKDAINKMILFYHTYYVFILYDIHDY